VRSSISLIEGYKYSGTTEASIPGAEYQLTVAITNTLGIQLKGGILQWDEMNLLTIPILAGVEYVVTRTDRNALAVYANAGPSGLIGKDYASIFATAEAGLQYGAVRNGFVIRCAWAENLAFHPSHFAFLKFGVGWTF